MSLKDQKVETKEKKAPVAEDKAAEKAAKSEATTTKKVADFFKGLDPRERVAAYAAISPAINDDNDKIGQGLEPDGSVYDSI